MSCASVCVLVLGATVFILMMVISVENLVFDSNCITYFHAAHCVTGPRNKSGESFNGIEPPEMVPQAKGQTPCPEP